MDGIDRIADEYLSERGFVVSTDVPDSFPYLALCGLEKSMDEYQVLMIGDGKSKGIFDIVHPITTNPDSLPGRLASFVASHAGDDNLGSVPGHPIPIFIADPAWYETAKVLALAYPAQGDMK